MRNLFVLLIFDHADEVVDTVMVRADDLRRARKIADMIMLTRPAAAGYQIWRDGARVHATFPEAADKARAPLILIAYRRKARAGRA